jgi:hypothetical protein
MKKIDLGKIILAKKIDADKLAKELFPSHKYPKLALDRVIKGEGVLDADQISRFSFSSGIPIAELYNQAGWTSRFEGNTHVLTSGDYSAELDSRTWTTKLFHKSTLFHSFVMHSQSITLGDYLYTLESEIQKAKK